MGGVRLRCQGFWRETARKYKARKSCVACGPRQPEVVMELGQGRTFHAHITIVFEWKMMAVIVSAHLIRLLMK